MRLKFKNDFLNRLLNVKLTSDLFFRLLIFYLICFSIYELPYLKAMYSPEGMIYNIGKNWTWWVLPLKSFYNIHSLAWVYFLKTIELLLFFLVLKRHFMALNFILLWIISFIFMQFNNDAQHPPLPYIGWSYIALAVYFFEKPTPRRLLPKKHTAPAQSSSTAE